MKPVNYKFYIKFGLVCIIAAFIVYFPASAAVKQQSLANNTTPLQEQLIPLPEELENYESGLDPNAYTSENYVQPQYDPFNNQYQPYHDFIEQIESSDRAANTAPKADFSIRTKPTGLADTNSGTTNTEFIFNAYAATDEESRDSRLLVRWDFESDGELDSYYSRTKSISHKFEAAGVYNVTLEVLDEGGLTAKTTKTVTVVNNTAPSPYFTYTPVVGTAEKIFKFDTSDSYDSQFKDFYLKYRFDWNGDGIWDTTYKQKTIWKHKFEDPGQYLVKMEVIDPDEAVATASAIVTVVQNQLPVANFTVEKKPVRVSQDVYRNKYYFDASDSTDPENPDKLMYRWDFNYTGPDDINFDTMWRTSPKYNGFFDFEGQKTVRLQVKDEDGAVVTAFASFVVE